MPRPTNRQIALLVAVAFVSGLLASLAVRPAGGAARASGGAGAAIEPIRWTLPVGFGTHLPVIGDITLLIAEMAASASAGAIRLEISEPGEIVPALGIVDAVRDGKVEAGLTWLGYDQGKIPSSTLFSAVPFGFEPNEFTAWWYEAGGRELAETVYAEHGVHPILCGLIGPEAAGWFRREIESVEDLRGLKIRFAGLGGRVLQKLGASVTVLPGAEIFPALEKGAIDATEFSLPVVDEKLGFARIAKQNYFPGWHQPFTSLHLVVGAETWRRLGDAARASLEVTCTAAVTRNLARSEAAQGPVLGRFAAAGVETRRLPDEILRRLDETTQQVLDEEAAKDGHFATVLASQRAFDAAIRPWRELGYLPRTWDSDRRSPPR